MTRGPLAAMLSSIRAASKNAFCILKRARSQNRVMQSDDSCIKPALRLQPGKRIQVRRMVLVSGRVWRQGSGRTRHRAEDFGYRPLWRPQVFRFDESGNGDVPAIGQRVPYVVCAVRD
jgi:hypothetical protein